MSYKKEDVTNTFGYSTDLSSFKLGYIGSTTTKITDNLNRTEYTKGSINGWLIVAVYIYANSGQWIPHLA